MLDRYRELLQSWGGKLALTSAGSLDGTGLDRHIQTARALAEHLPNGSPFVDLGSGNGLPAIPVAICRQVSGELIEADRRKAAFLTVAAARLGLALTITAQRIEATPPRNAACVTAQALAPLDRLLPLVHRHLHPQGVALLLKGRRVGEELEVAGKHWQMKVVEIRLGQDTTLLRVSDLAPC